MDTVSHTETHAPAAADSIDSDVAIDPNAVRFADMPEIEEHVVIALERAGMTTAFPIQVAVIPLATSGRDVLVKAPTGSGKTLAFGLPIVEQLERGGNKPNALILVPTRELAVQVCNDLNPIAWAKQIRCVAVYGGAPMMRQAKKAADSQIIVATPGRLADFMNSRMIDLSQVKILVLDEADRMLDMGFQPQVDEIVEGMRGERQTMLFSATLDGKVGKVARAYTTDPETIENSTAPGEGGEIDHVMMATSNHAKIDAVMDILADAARDLAVIFVRTQRGAENLKEALRTLGHRATAIHGGMSQPERTREFNRYKDETCDVLVATDVFSRGMDLDRITHVINYEIPEDADTYRHRTGRTGRAGRSGTAITLVAPSQRKTMERMTREAGLAHGLLHQMRKPSGIRYEEVPAAERYTDPPERDRRYSAAKPGQNRYSKSGGSGYQGKSEGKFSRDEKPSWGKGNGRGQDSKPAYGDRNDRPCYSGSNSNDRTKNGGSGSTVSSNDRHSFAPRDRSTFKRDERPSFKREDRPTFTGANSNDRTKNGGSDDRPAFSAGSDSSAYSRYERPSSPQGKAPSYPQPGTPLHRPAYAKSNDRPAYSNDRPSYAKSNDRPSRSNDRPSYASNGGSDRGGNRGGGSTNAGAGKGVITNYNDDKGFGFIEQSSGGKDVFFHRNVFSGADKSRLKAGLTVSFALESGDGSKLRAKGVELAGR